MDDMDAFERQLSAELRVLMGPVRPVDDAAIYTAIMATGSPTLGVRPMFSAIRFVTAGLVAALLGAFVLTGTPRQFADDLVPAASGQSSDSPRLVYMLDGDIYVAAEDGTDPVRIVDGDSDAECGGLRDNRGLVSPDGRHIAYRSDWSDDCPGMVFIADLEGHSVASVPGVGWDIAWAPDSTRFATWLSFSESIGVYGIDGSLHAELDDSDHSSGEYDPRWTPDGTALLMPGAIDVAGLTHGLVSRLPLDGGEPEIVPITDPLSIRSVSYSPDGTRVASEGPDSQLVVAALDGTRPGFEFYFTRGEVDGGWARPPLWSPNGDRIAVVASSVSTDTAGNQVRHSADLWVVYPTTGISTMVDTVEGDGDLEPVAFSPDGDRILVRKVVADGVSGLWTVASDGSGSTVIVAGDDIGAWAQPLSPPG